MMTVIVPNDDGDVLGVPDNTEASKPPTEPDKDLPTLYSAVLRYREALDHVRVQVSTIAEEEADVLNRYNEACLLFDQAVLLLRADSPSNTEWSAGEGSEEEWEEPASR